MVTPPRGTHAFIDFAKMNYFSVFEPWPPKPIIKCVLAGVEHSLSVEDVLRTRAHKPNIKKKLAKVNFVLSLLV